MPVQIAQGDVWEYQFLWPHEAALGEVEGRKPRPCVVALMITPKEGEARQILLTPITSKEPGPETAFIEIPDTEKRRAGLDDNIRLFVILDQYNTDDPDHSFVLEPGAKLGSFTHAFLTQLVERLRAVLLTKTKYKSVNRR